MPENQEEFLRTARDRFRAADEAERENRDEAAKDLRFLAGDQWDPKVKKDRELAGRPALVINRLPTFVAQEVNEARQNKPAIKVAPVDSGIDVDTADVVQGLVRHIEYDSDAEVAYVNAVQYAASCGMGYFRILTNYSDDESFDQEVRIEQIEDPFTVYFDPHAKRQDRSDANYCFVRTRLSHDAYKADWPDSEAAKSNFFEGYDARDGDWISDDEIAVAEYWYVDVKPRQLLYLSDGSKGFADELQIPEGVTVLKERTVQARTVRCAKINGQEILEDEEWPGKWIPVIPVFGNSLIVDGKRKLFSLIRFQRDPQALFNFYKTSMAEVVQLAPRSPWIGAEGQFANHEGEWKTANQINYAYLQYKPVSVNGQPVGAPQRNIYEPPIQALSIGAMQASDDMKSTAGIFDASLGAQSNETSGIAIARRQAESNTANFHFQDNLARAQKHCGRIIVNLIPKIYDAEREVRILGEDQSQKVVKVNAQYQDPNGRMRHYDLSIGKYDVTVATGPSYATKRQESFAMMTEWSRAYPALLQIAGDIIFRNSDMPGADQIADRLKKTLPPNLAEDDNERPAQIPPQFQQQMQALMQQHQMLTQALNQATETINTKKLELESRERIATLQTQAQLVMTEAKLQSQEGIEMLRQEIGAVSKRLELLHMGNQLAADQEQAEQDRAFQQQQGDQERQMPQMQAGPVDAIPQPRPSLDQFEEIGGEPTRF